MRLSRARLCIRQKGEEMKNELKEADCYACQNFFPRYNCNCRPLPFVLIPSAMFGGRRLRGIRCKQRGTVKCSEYVKRIKEQQLTIWDNL